MKITGYVFRDFFGNLYLSTTSLGDSRQALPLQEDRAFSRLECGGDPVQVTISVSKKRNNNK